MVERVDRAVVRLDREIEVRRQREELVPHAEIVPSLNRKVPADGVRGSTRSEEGRAPDLGLGGRAGDGDDALEEVSEAAVGPALNDLLAGIG